MTFLGPLPLTSYALSVCHCFGCRAFITWLAYGDTIRILKMSKKQEGSMNFKTVSDDFPIKHKGSILNIGIAETGKTHKKF